MIDRPRQPIRSGSDSPDRAALATQAGNLAPVFESELSVFVPDRNTLCPGWCCTSFVNSGGDTFVLANNTEKKSRLLPLARLRVVADGFVGGAEEGLGLVDALHLLAFRA